MSELTNVILDGIDFNDYPDFSDAFVVSAERNCVQLTDDELDEINSDSSLVYELVLEQII